MADRKQLIIEQLEIMRKKDLAEKKPFQARAYAKVIAGLKGLDSVRTIKDVEGLEGVGTKIRAKIQEILETGRLEAAERAKSAYDASAYDAILAIHGVGPVKARKLIEEEDITSIAELRRAVKQNPKLLTASQKLGLLHYEDLLERIPREEMDKHKDFLASLIPKGKGIKYELTGSYRRGKETSGDIDMLICIPDEHWDDAQRIFKQYIRDLTDAEYIRGVYSLGEHKFMGICGIADGKSRHIDIMITTEAEYPFAVLYFTGSDKFNIAMRKHALELGYSLNEKALTPVPPNTRIPQPLKSERAIFAFLDMDYTPPQER